MLSAHCSLRRYDVTREFLNSTKAANTSAARDASNEQNVMIYTGLLLAYLLLVTAYGVITGTVLILASGRAYGKMVASVLRAPLSFFQSNALGMFMFTFVKSLNGGDVSN